MSPLTSSALRSLYLDFFRSHDHAIIESAPLLPDGDASVLFNTAGMQPLVPYLLGEKHPMGRRLADVQKCVRTGDIDDIGDATHLSFFEMLGNWSLGDYFKKESIAWSYEFLTDKKWLGIDPSWLSVTVFAGDENAPRDDESAAIWRSLGIPETRISYLPAEDNWWAAGPTGPCGPDTEIFYWIGEGQPDPASNVGKEPKKWMEIWNNVFMEYNRKSVSKVLLLDGMYCLFDENFQVHADVLARVKSLGLRTIVVTMAPRTRLAPVLDETGFEGVTYETEVKKTDPEFFRRLLRDKGLQPSDVVYIDHLSDNLQSARQAGISSCELFENVDSLGRLGAHLFTLEKLPAQNVDTGMGLERITATLGGVKSVYETDIFADVLVRIREIVGAERYDMRSARIIADHLRAATHMIADGVVPRNVDQGYILRRLIRRAIREFSKMGVDTPQTTEIAKMYIEKFKGVYASIVRGETKILEELAKEEEQFRKTLAGGIKRFEQGFRELSGSTDTEKLGWMAFDLFQTYGFPFEMTIELLNEKAKAENIIFSAKDIQNAFNEEMKKHQDISRVGAEMKFKGGLADTSDATVRLHSATHLMLAGLRKVLGDHIHQAGSNITIERLRFDFTHPAKMTDDELHAVEDYVNTAIQADAAMILEELPKETARASGVEGSFWEKYPEIVKVYTFKAADGTIYSRELCGGPHVERTSVLKKFRILKEESSSAGVRRIKAIIEK